LAQYDRTEQWTEAMDLWRDIDEATSLGDDERLALATADRDYLVRELARAYGLGGRSRLTGATSERARARPSARATSA
jgi:hypothetical protein